MDVITSRTNPTVRLVRSLMSRRAVRYREGLFVAEGLRAIQTLIDQGAPLTALLVDAERQVDVTPDLLQAAQQLEARVLPVSAGIFEYLSDVDTPQPVIGVFEMAQLAAPQAPRSVVALDGIQDPGNLGSILRTCRAAGVELVLLLPGTVDPYNPKVVRSTAGQFSGFPMIPLSTVENLYREIQQVPDRIVIADSRGTTGYTAFDWTLPFVLVLGSEASGPGHDWSSITTDRVRIGMEPGVESLNVAAAAAVMLFEARRQRERI